MSILNVERLLKELFYKQLEVLEVNDVNLLKINKKIESIGADTEKLVTFYNTSCKTNLEKMLKSYDDFDKYDLEELYQEILKSAPLVDNAIITKRQEKIQAINKSFKEKLLYMEQIEKQKVAAINKRQREAYNTRLLPYKELQEKLSKIQEYREEINSILAYNDLNVKNLSMDFTEYTYDQITSMMDRTIAFLDSRLKKERLSLDSGKIKKVELRALAILGVFTLATIPFVSDLLGISFLGYFAFKQKKSKRLVNNIALAYCLLVDLDLNSIITQRVEPVKVIKEEGRSFIDDSNPEYLEIIKEWKLELLKVETFEQLQQRYDDYMRGFKEEKQAFEERVKEYFSQIKERMITQKEKVESLLNKAINEVNHFIANNERFPYSVNKGVIFDSKFVLSNSVDGIKDDRIDVGYKNMIIEYDSSQEQDKDDFANILALNLLCSVNYRMMRVCFVDPINKGRSSSCFINEYTKGCINIMKTTEEFTKDRIETMELNARTLSGKDIIEYNSQADEKDYSPNNYTVYIIVSGGEDLLNDKSFTNLLVSSQRSGILFYVFAKGLDKSKVNLELAYYSLWGAPYEHIRDKKIIDPSDIQSIMEDYGSIYDNTKPKALMREDSINNLKKFMMDRYVRKKRNAPDKEIKRIETEDLFTELWTVSPENFTQLHLGCENGDKAKQIVMKLGITGDVHGLIGGATGAGKSVLNNYVIISACMMHSPEDLRIVLIDGKGAEFTNYMKEGRLKWQLPHVDAVACTSDVAYIASLLESYVKEARDRFDLCKELKVKDLPTLNRLIREGKPEFAHLKPFPSILIFIDEFGVIVETKDEEAKQRCFAALSEFGRLTRTVRINALLSTQNYTKSMPDSTESQFTARVCLRVQDAATSNKLIGSPVASTILEKFGMLYFKGQSDPLPIRCKTPFIDSESDKYEVLYNNEKVKINELWYCIKMLEEEAIKRNFRYPRPIAYNEQKIFSLDVLEKFLSMNPNKGNLFYLGEKMTFDLKDRAPVVRELDRLKAPGTHITSLFPIMEDMYNFYKTCELNIKVNSKNYCGKEAMVLYKSCDMTVETSFGIQNIKGPYKSINKLNEQWFKTENNMNSYLSEVIDPLIASRKKKRQEEGPESLSTPVYVFCFGVEQDSAYREPGSRNMLRNRIGTVLGEADNLNMHFIFISSEEKFVSDDTVKAYCSVKVCGKVASRMTSMSMIGNPTASLIYMIDKNYAFVAINDKESQRFKLYHAEGFEGSGDEWVVVGDREF